MAERLLVVIGSGLVLAGLVLGFTLSVYSGDVDCGSAFASADTFNSGCKDAQAAARPIPALLLIVGSVLAIGAAVIRPRQSDAVTPARREQDRPT